MRGVAIRTTLTLLAKSLQPEGRSRSTLRPPGSGCELHLRLLPGLPLPTSAASGLFCCSIFQIPISNFKPSSDHPLWPLE